MENRGRTPTRPLFSPKPNEESLESIRDAEAILASEGHGYHSAREMLDAALKA